ncbi:hypothetical protein SMICM304S_01422 [Streptomyces microflavus]
MSVRSCVSACTAPMALQPATTPRSPPACVCANCSTWETSGSERVHPPLPGRPQRLRRSSPARRGHPSGRRRSVCRSEFRTLGGEARGPHRDRHRPCSLDLVLRSHRRSPRRGRPDRRTRPPRAGARLGRRRPCMLLGVGAGFTWTSPWSGSPSVLEWPTPPVRIRPRGSADLRGCYVSRGRAPKEGIGRNLFGRVPRLPRRADRVLGYPIEELCLGNPERRLSETVYAQPAIYVVNALHWSAAQEDLPPADFFAGRCLGGAAHVRGRRLRLRNRPDAGATPCGTDRPGQRRCDGRGHRSLRADRRGNPEAAPMPRASSSPTCRARTVRRLEQPRELAGHRSRSSRRWRVSEASSG